jgi:uncharacterized protein YndB with AHSA1/START domain
MVTAIVVVVLLVAALLAYLSAQPSDFRIARTLSMKASAEDVYRQVADLRNLNTWNPFALQDPQITLTYSGTDSGKGAAYNWNGPKSGVGRMEIVDVDPAKRVTLKLDFSKPFEAHNDVDFTFQPSGGETNVTWEMRGTRNLMMKAMGLFFSMDRMVGGEFEKGLATLKTISERK